MIIKIPNIGDKIFRVSRLKDGDFIVLDPVVEDFYLGLSCAPIIGGSTFLVLSTCYLLLSFDGIVKLELTGIGAAAENLLNQWFFSFEDAYEEVIDEQRNTKNS